MEIFEIMRKYFIYTLITQIILLISGLGVYSIASHKLGLEGFSEYTLSRRIVSFLQLALLLGLGVGIPRYVAYNINNEKVSYKYFNSFSVAYKRFTNIFTIPCFCYSYFSSNMNIKLGNILQIINLAIFPFSGLFLASDIKNILLIKGYLFY